LLRGRRAGTFLAAVFLRGCAFLAAGRFLLTLFLGAAFLRLAFWAALRLAFLAALRLAFLVAGFFFADFFFEAAFFLLAGAAFFRVTLRFLAADFFAAAFLADTFLRDAGAFLRFLLAVFFAGIFYSCGTEKRPGLYIDVADMEPLFSEYFLPSGGRLSFCCDNRFIARFLLH
jgi:hypothetical protein